MMTIPMSRDELVKEVLPALSMLYSSTFALLSAVLSIVLGVLDLGKALLQFVLGAIGVVMWFGLVARVVVAAAQQWASEQARSYRI